MIRRVLLVTVVVFPLMTAARASAQGRQVQAADGDVVLVPPNATITVARSTPGRIRVSAHEGGYVLVVVVDEGPQPDGIADFSRRFQLTQPYLPQFVFEGAGSFEEFETVGPKRMGRSYGIGTPQGRILLTSGQPGALPVTPPDHIAAFSFKQMGGNQGRWTFDEAEKLAVEGYPGVRFPTMQTGVTGSVAGGVVGGVVGGVSVPQPPPPPDGPVRVGGNLRQPKMVHHVPAVLPEAAARAGVRGVVIVEATVDRDGRVSDVRVLRSIPLLDQAAIDAVRQWIFQPTLLNGVPVPVIMTVTVPFNQ